jgi:uncharacterized membrane protein YqjE
MADRTDSTDLRDRSLGELMKRLADETGTLVRQEIDLAKAELAEKGKTAGTGAGMFGGAGLIGVLALASLTACLIGALDTAMPFWLAALIVAAAYGAIAGVLALSGKKKVQEATPPAPEQTIESVKEDVQWAKSQAQSAKR